MSPTVYTTSISLKKRNRQILNFSFYFIREREREGIPLRMRLSHLHPRNEMETSEPFADKATSNYQKWTAEV